MKGSKRETFLRNVFLITIFLFTVLMVSGCTREVSWIHAEPKSVELKQIGDTIQIRFSPLDKENKPVPGAKLRFESTRSNVAVIGDTGLITAKGTGNTIISIISEKGEKAVIQCKVSVRSKLLVDPADVTMTVGEKIKLIPNVVDEKGAPFEDQVVSWASSDDTVAAVDDFGGVTATGEGTATVTGTQIDVYGGAVITVLPGKKISIK